MFGGLSGRTGLPAPLSTPVTTGCIILVLCNKFMACVLNVSWCYTACCTTCCPINPQLMKEVEYGSQASDQIIAPPCLPPGVATSLMITQHCWKAVFLSFSRQLGYTTPWDEKLLYTASQKNIPDIFNCNLKTNYRILIIFGRNIPDTTCHQMTIYFFTSPNVCFCTT